jgi:putative DNA primase/helicase
MSTQATIARPALLPLMLENVPAELRAKPAWVGWKQVWIEPTASKPGRWNKVPVSIRSDGPAETDNPSTWVDFDTAADKYQRLGCDGIGLCRTGDFI